MYFVKTLPRHACDYRTSWWFCFIPCWKLFVVTVVALHLARACFHSNKTKCVLLSALHAVVDCVDVLSFFVCYFFPCHFLSFSSSPSFMSSVSSWPLDLFFPRSLDVICLIISSDVAAL